MKTGRMTREDRAYLEKNMNKTVAYLARKLGRQEKAIKAAIKDIKQKEEDAILEKAAIKAKKIEDEKLEAERQAESDKHIKVGDLFGRTKNALVMTPAVSSIMDDVVKKTIKKKYSSCIHKISGK